MILLLHPVDFRTGVNDFPTGSCRFSYWTLWILLLEFAIFLLGRVAACEDAGISRNQIILDPGFGFGKMLDAVAISVLKVQGLPLVK